MPKHERREVLRMLKLVQKAQKEINRETTDGEKTMVLGKYNYSHAHVHTHVYVY